MSVTTRTPSNVTLTVLDTDGALAGAQAFVSKHKGADHVASFAFGPYAAVEKDGDLFVICTEGVGWKVTDESPLELDIYAAPEGHIGILPVATARLSPAEVRDMMSAATVPLHDHIRSFGARLEDNYSSWVRRLQPTPHDHDEACDAGECDVVPADRTFTL